MFEKAHDPMLANTDTMLLDVYYLAEDKYGHVVESDGPVIVDMLVDLREVRRYADVDHLSSAELYELTFKTRAGFNTPNSDDEVPRFTQFIDKVNGYTRRDN